MKAGKYLSRLARKIIENEYDDMLEIIGAAAAIIDPDKELSSTQMNEIAERIEAECSDVDENLDLALAIGRFINEA